MIIQNKNISERFYYIVKKHEKNTALIYKDNYLTYEELYKKSGEISNYLIEQGIKKGDCIGITCTNRLNYILSILSIIRLGAVYVPLDYAWEQKMISQYISEGNIKRIITDYKSDLQKLINISDVKANGNISLPEVEWTENMLAYIMFTSGTTGIPKGVGVTHSNILNLVLNSNFVSLDSNVRILQTGDMTFDASTFEIWGALLNGGTLILQDKEALLDSKKLKGNINQYKATTMWLTSPLFKIYAKESPDIFYGLKELIVGGDVVDPEDVNKVIDICGDSISIYNGYGPTECTTFSIVHKISEYCKEDKIPIGIPVQNVEPYVLDEDLHLVPEDNIGELYIGGTGVANGYVNVKNEGSFVRNPFKKGILYKTGDLVVRKSNGLFYFYGRKDRQVKIRGFRIELDDVELRLRKIKGVNNAAVCILENENESKEIAAYIVGNTSMINDDYVRQEFGEIAPKHYVLSRIYISDNLPINKNGKIDYKKIQKYFKDLKKEEFKKKKEIANENLAKLSEIVSRRIGKIVDDMSVSFFQLGIDSLEAVYIAQDINETFDCQISAMDILKNPRIIELVKLIDDLKKKNKEVEDISLNCQEIELLNRQKAIFADYNINPEKTRYNIPVLLKIAKNISIEKLQSALKNIVRNQEALRTKFVMKEGEIRQYILNEVNVEIEMLEQVKVERLIKPFDLYNDPLFRFSIIKNEDEIWLFMDFHHIIVDGNSLNIILKNLEYEYQNEDVQASNISYMQLLYVEKKRYDAEKNKCLSYWNTRFQDNLEMYALPIDFDNQEKNIYKNSVVCRKINKKCKEKLKEWCVKHKTTFFEGLIVAYAKTLHMITGGNNVLFATPCSNKSRQSENVVAMLTDTLWVESKIGDINSFDESIERFINNFRESREYINIDINEMHKLIEKINKSPNSETLIAYHTLEESQIEILGKTYSIRPISPPDGMFLLNFQIYENTEDLEVYIEYYEKFFEKNTIYSIFDIFESIINSL